MSASIGLPRNHKVHRTLDTRDYLENFVYLDIFDDRNGLLEALVSGTISLRSNTILNGTVWRTRDRHREPLTEQPFFKQSQNLTGFSFFARKDKLPTIPENQWQDIVLVSQSSLLKNKGNTCRQIMLARQHQCWILDRGFWNYNLDDRWRQLGFTWNGGAGLLSVFVDASCANKRISGQDFKGPMNVLEKTKVIVASEKSDSAHKNFAGQIDEICIFDRLLNERQWQEMADITSDKNLNTMGLAQAATAWWRMGDSLEDTLANSAPGSKIIDRIWE